MNNECIYCGFGPVADWLTLKTHLVKCVRKKMVDTNRDEFKGAYGFWPDFDQVRSWIDEVRSNDTNLSLDEET